MSVLQKRVNTMKPEVIQKFQAKTKKTVNIVVTTKRIVMQRQIKIN
jgi:hypothetical protein